MAASPIGFLRRHRIDDARTTTPAWPTAAVWGVISLMTLEPSG